jgi:hypothetical protein
MINCPLCKTGKIKQISYITYKEMECDNCETTIDELHLSQALEIKELKEELKVLMGK